MHELSSKEVEEARFSSKEAKAPEKLLNFSWKWIPRRLWRVDLPSWHDEVRYCDAICKLRTVRAETSNAKRKTVQASSK